MSRQPAPPHQPGHVIEHPAEVDVVVVSRQEAAADVAAFELRAAGDGVLPPWEPGAHIDLLLPNGLERQYSLCGSPGDLETWRVGVLREPDGRGGSAWVHDELHTGQALRVRGPRNNFPLQPATAYRFVAGGIGVTPLLPMIRLLQSRGRDWSLLYGGRRRDSMAFVDELQAFGDRVTIAPQDEVGLLDLDSLLGVPQDGVAVYCCGPEPLLQAVEARCAGWPSGALHVERFKPRPGALDGPDAPFEVVLERSGVTLSVAAGQTIVEALEAAGFDVLTSCREGTCGTCETEVFEGTVDHRDSFLSAEDREEGATMMICCSRALEGPLVLDL